MVMLAVLIAVVVLVRLLGLWADDRALSRESRRRANEWAAFRDTGR